ncbi:hypothetical protein T4B_5973 [Trichinella pseudospiralis]|uniref:Uncharacterized protein n=1 Tax=Trichinella pseudospiralis TaxID=6337 RepID=A0A0V1DRE4_TRIPS|nr:hypothetical protein T4A_491 [Trichinella pseudospiralis]KRY97685.1 hypothetical protein T4B_5973 [Trichinella pseudospiralis]
MPFIAAVSQDSLQALLTLLTALDMRFKDELTHNM